MAHRPDSKRIGQIDFIHPACLPAMSVALQYHVGERPAVGLVRKLFQVVAKAFFRRKTRLRRLDEAARLFEAATAKRFHGQYHKPALRSLGS